MGYACPVCGDPQQDASHLANHLAFTAMLGDDDHEAWLDEHVPGWERGGESELAARVTEHAEETEFPQVFEDTTGGSHGGDRDGHDHRDEPAHPPGEPAAVADVEPRDEETQRALAEARELTRELRSERGAPGAGEDDGTGDTGDGGRKAGDGDRKAGDGEPSADAERKPGSDGDVDGT